MRVAVVTGANKGIGYAIVRGLCKKFEGDVFLTARDESRGKSAVEELIKEGLKAKFHQLDVEDKESIERLKKFLLEKYGGLDILVNNAGFAYKENSTATMSEQAEVTLNINTFGTINVCKALFPLLQPHARVVNVSSRVGTLDGLTNEKIRKQLLSPDLTEETVVNLANQFVQDVKNGRQKENGWKMTCYGMSKVFVTALSFVHAREFKKDSRKDIVLNACCPGLVATDMSSHGGQKTIDEGADTPLYLALLPPNIKSPVGEFVGERNIISWVAVDPAFLEQIRQAQQAANQAKTS